MPVSIARLNKADSHRACIRERGRINGCISVWSHLQGFSLYRWTQGTKMHLLYFTKTSGLKSACDSIYFLIIFTLPPFYMNMSQSGPLQIAVQGIFCLFVLFYSGLHKSWLLAKYLKRAWWKDGQTQSPFIGPFLQAAP